MTPPPPRPEPNHPAAVAYTPEQRRLQARAEAIAYYGFRLSTPPRTSVHRATVREAA